MKRRISFPVILLLAFATLGCADILKVPAFNPNARLANRIASAKEVCGKMYAEVAELVADGVITQEFANKSLNPLIDTAYKSADDAQKLYDAFKLTEAQDKYNNDTEKKLRDLRDLLTRLHEGKP